MKLDSGTHSFCDDCFQAALPPNRTHRIEPTRTAQAEPLPCCVCNAEHQSGIFIRRDPSTLACKGDHKLPGPPA